MGHISAKRRTAFRSNQACWSIFGLCEKSDKEEQCNMKLLDVDVIVGDGVSLPKRPLAMDNVGKVVLLCYRTEETERPLNRPRVE